ncbi:PREDICTED: uncharacterized protein LOC106924312 [Poecilia mexicana]|uniref:uncharacterized protein LOC106924312 n=1 Tax=Poecilia mexicana TaxID=48701 RepID=UPI00072DD9E9|nr:PREDICTED: uncharacterized protein LOC106924312 [Poecilia mexicana]
MKKSNLTPSQGTVFLGMAMNSVSMTACPSPQRVSGILGMLPEFGRGMAPPLVRYLRLLGMLTAASAVVPLVLLSLRPLQMWLNSLHLDSTRYAHRRRRLRVGPQCLQSLSQWRVKSFMTQGVPLGSLPCRREVVHGCILHGLGCNMAGSSGTGDMVPAAVPGTQQLPGISGCVSRSPELSSRLRGEACAGEIRQHLCGFSHQPPRGDQVQETILLDSAAPDLGSPMLDQPQGSLHPRATERVGRFSIPSEAVSRRMETSPGGGGVHLDGFRQGGCGRISLSPLVLLGRQRSSGLRCAAYFSRLS